MFIQISRFYGKKSSGLFCKKFNHVLESCNKPGGSALPQPLLLGLLGLWPVLVHQLEQLGGCKQCG